jgi:hypothetical protein
MVEQDVAIGGIFEQLEHKVHESGRLPCRPGIAVPPSSDRPSEDLAAPTSFRLAGAKEFASTALSGIVMRRCIDVSARFAQGAFGRGEELRVIAGVFGT